MNTENKTSYCTLCREPQTETQDGFQCRNGHLGAGSIPAVYGNDDEVADWGNLTGHPAQVYELAAVVDSTCGGNLAVQVVNTSIALRDGTALYVHQAARFAGRNSPATADFDLPAAGDCAQPVQPTPTI